jgi:hypothetical protein
MQVDRLGLGHRFHQIGFAVPAPQDAFQFLGGLGFSVTFDPLQNVNVALRHHPATPDVKVLWPADGRTPIDQLVRHGHMAGHLCYISNDPPASLDAMMASGLDVLEGSAPMPARLFGGVPVSFNTVDHLGPIELIHGEPRPMNIR